MNKSVIYKRVRDKLSEAEYKVKEMHEHIISAFRHGEDYEEIDDEVADKILELYEQFRKLNPLLDSLVKKNRQVEWKRNKKFKKEDDKRAKIFVENFRLGKIK